MQWLFDFLSKLFSNNKNAEPVKVEPTQPIEKKEMFMISLKELNPKGFNLTQEQSDNLDELHAKINKVRDAYGSTMTVSSGVRDIAGHKKIYLDKGIPEDKIPMGSLHLKGAACDIADSNRSLANWCKANESTLAVIGLWMEDLSVTTTWVHFQIYPPKSGKRFFMP